MTSLLVAALYKFVTLNDFQGMQAPLLQKCLDAGIKGTLLLAGEGINGTIAGSDHGVRDVLAYLRSDPRLADLAHKESRAGEPPFLRMKVRLKKEIVTLGIDGIDPLNLAGTYVAPEHWNDLISDPEVVVIDTRNDYEVEIGSFAGAVNPRTTSFREFPDWVRHSDILNRDTKPKVAMYCTGGIRCEKSTAYLKQLGFEEVFHLQGGILKYLEIVPESKSLWRGECFVFDDRVSVGHGLAPGPYDLCHACRHAIDDDDKASPKYVEGVSCPHCADTSTDAQKSRYAERQKQMALAAARNQTHLGKAIE